jgi:hypothetical protein
VSWYKIGTQENRRRPILPTLTSIVKMLGQLFGRAKDESSIYIDLAPTDNADPDGIYSRALTSATRSPNVYNIALTGPYGSGKSSIIRTFLKSYKKPALQISLAAFLPDAQGTASSNARKDGVPRHEIERSILQQMLYGADANRLPLSRFSRIKKPKWWSALISLHAILGIAACIFVFYNRDAIFSDAIFRSPVSESWLAILSLVLGFSFAWFIAHQTYIASYGLSLKSISLKNVEILPKANDEGSILNRHLDEIIYFFQSTDYELVVVEDLDRFQNPEIFVSLREINSLINANAGVNRQIRFLYALRDNMFASTDRTKFFEFIVPVIPIINSSNSIDKILEQGERLSLDERLDRQFLREVSRYLSDLRLIQNIFNEYATYVASLEKGNEAILNANKLLAVLIYKNVLPSDFEALHQNRGKFAQILARHGELVAGAEAAISAEILEWETALEEADKQVSRDKRELQKIYAASIIQKTPANFTHIQVGGQWAELSALPGHPKLETVIEATQVQFRWAQTGHLQSIDLSNLQREVDPLKSYAERREDVERKSKEFKDKTSKNIRQLRQKKSKLRFSKFNEIIRSNLGASEELFDRFGDNRELIRFLVLEGYLDDTYYQYTSLFHSGRLSPSDNNFLIQIRAFKNPEPDFQIDNPKEIIFEMRDDDFRQKFALNRTIVDSLFEGEAEYHWQIDGLVDFVSSNFDESQDFLLVYYESGKHVAELLSALFEGWSGLVPAMLESSNSVLHVAQIIAKLPERQLRQVSHQDVRIGDFLGTRLSEILALEIDLPPNRLQTATFELVSLNSIIDHPAIARYLAESKKFEISVENIEYIFNEIIRVQSADNLRTKNYSAVLASESQFLIEKVEGAFEKYLERVLFQLDENINEEVPAIISAIGHEEIETEVLQKFLSRQRVKLPSLEGVPERLRTSLFELRKIEVSWDNCLAYIESDSYDPEVLTKFLQDAEVKDALSQISLGAGKEALSLRTFLVSNEEFDDDYYRAYVRILPRNFRDFPDDLSSAKLAILIDEGKVTFSDQNFAHLDGRDDLQVSFIVENIASYFRSDVKDKVDDDFREKLLISNISDSDKFKVVEELDLLVVPQIPSRAAIIGSVIYSTGATLSNLTADVAQAIIIHSKPIAVQISLFNRWQRMMSDDAVRETLGKLAEPYSKIEVGYNVPILAKTNENLELVAWLVDRRIVSSFGETIYGKIRIHNFRK